MLNLMYKRAIEAVIKIGFQNVIAKRIAEFVHRYKQVPNV